MARDFSFFGGDHHSFRIIVPALVGMVTNPLGITNFDSVALVFGTWNFALFLFGIGVMLRIAIYEQSINVFELILPTLLILFLPFTLTAAFYPLPDAGIFLVFALIFLALFYRNLSMLFIITIVAAWISEATLLAFLIIPVLNYIRDDNWWQAYYPFILCGVIYITLLFGLSSEPSNHYLLHPNGWMTEIGSNFLQIDRNFFLKLLPTFGLTIPFFAYRIYKGGYQKVIYSTLMLMAAYYIIFLLIAPEQAGRFMFMTMPLLVLLNFNDQTIEGLRHKINPL
ncbi:MAG: hypothetical protein WD037_01565 [Balneolales bacterium]